MEQRDAREESLVQFVGNALELSVKRQRLAMLLAERRCTGLHRIGTALTILAVFAPILSGYFYLEQDPAADLRVLKQLEVVPEKITELPARDWHLLAGGLSFGFLFIASARSLLNQEAKQRHTYFRVAWKVTYYNDLAAAVRIAERMGGDPDSGRVLSVVARIIDHLTAMRDEPPYDSSDAGLAVGNTGSAEYVEIMKQATRLGKGA